MPEMDEMDENDIIVVLADGLRSGKREDHFTVEYAILDEALNLPVGSTLKYLEVAAKDAGLEVTRKGSTKASLRKVGGVPPASVVGRL